ncbi:MAG: hypothetical protein K0R18_246 [Bacillales bacterium]|jgi:hypothetical protein|nr:hypothetical protein [Bacillales bacterium]
MYKFDDYVLVRDMKQTQVTKVMNCYVAGYIECRKFSSRNEPFFVASDMVGIEYENNSPVVLKNGARLSTQQLTELILELQQLKEFMESRKLIEELADN